MTRYNGGDYVEGRDLRINTDRDVKAFDQLPHEVRQCLNYAPVKYSAGEILDMLRSGQMTAGQIVVALLGMHPEIRRELEANERRSHDQPDADRPAVEHGRADGPFRRHSGC